ncbi:MAG: hypothetical protein V9G42_04685 [Bacteroidia bacterium]
MDKRIFALFIALLILLGIIIGLRILLHDCEIPEIEINNLQPEVGESVIIKSESDEEITWFINDKNLGKSSQLNYVFTQEGKAIIKAVINDKCEKIREIDVKPPCTVKSIIPLIAVPESITENEPCIFTNKTELTKSIQWKVEQTQELSTANEFRTTFIKSGIYTITVSVIGKCFKGDTTFSINVNRPKKVVIKEEPKEIIFSPIASPVKKAKVEKINFDESVFIQDFVNYANMLATSSEKWPDVASKFCTVNKIELFVEGSLFKTKNIEGFRKFMIADNFLVESAIITSKDSHNCVSGMQVTLKRQ